MSIDEIHTPNNASGRPVSEPALGQSQIGTTPVYSHVWEDAAELNAKLREIVLHRAATTPGLQKSQCGGWQSERNLQLWGDPAIDELLDRMRAMVKSVVRATVQNPGDDLLEGWDIEAWANVNQLGDTVTTHVHSGGVNMWAAVYYVDCGEDENAINSGYTRFLDMSGIPRPVSNKVQAATSTLSSRGEDGKANCTEPERTGEYDLESAPIPGKMIVFPATLPHYVTPYLGNQKRITIALNLRHTKFVVTDFENHFSRRRQMWRNYRGLMMLMYNVKKVIRENLAKYVPVDKWPARVKRSLLGGGGI